MTPLSATAVISAHDRASAVFARVGANARALGGRFTTAMGGLQRFGQAAAMNLGMPAAMVGAMAARGEYELDKLSRVMQAAGELSDQQRKMLTDKAFDVSRATGESAAEILKGQRELILGGLDADTAAATSSIIAKVARTNEVTAQQVAEDSISVASALGLAMDTTANKVKSLEKAMNFMSVVPALSVASWQDTATAMKYAGPVASSLKIPLEDVGAALSLLANAGFKSEEGGTAFRTMMMRLAVPTRKARMELRAAGIDLSAFMKLNTSRLADKNTLIGDLLEAKAIVPGQVKEIMNAVEPIDVRNYEGRMAEYVDDLNEIITKKLGIAPGDAQNRAEISTALMQHIYRSISEADVGRAFTALKGAPVSLLRELFGLQRVSQGASLAQSINEFVTTPDGETISQWNKLRKEVTTLLPDAAERRAIPVLKGFSASMDQMGASLANIRHQIFASGFGDEISGVFSRLSESVNEMAKQDPEKLKQIGYAISAMVVAPVAGYAVGGIAALGQGLASLAKGLTELGTAVLRAPMLMRLLAAGGIGGLLLGGGNLSGLFGQDERGGNGAIMARQVGPLNEFLTSLSGLGREAAGAIGDIGTKADEAFKGLQGLLGLDTSKSTLGTFLSGAAEAADRIAAGLRDVRRFFGDEPANPKETVENGGLAGLGAVFGIGLDALTNPNGQPRGGPFDWMFDKDAAHNVRLRRERYQSDLAGGPGAPGNLPSIRAQFPDAGMQRVEGKAEVKVHGTFDGNVTSDVRVHVDNGRVVDQSTAGGAVSGKLDPGESSMDLQGQ
jgi:TP901 family phage tail tape measure protein